MGRGLGSVLMIALAACGGTAVPRASGPSSASEPPGIAEPRADGERGAGGAVDLDGAEADRARRSEASDRERAATSTARLESAHRIDDAVTWARLAARPATSTVARTEVVKLLVDLVDGRRLWFVDTERWEIHYFFARDRLSTPEHPVGSTPDDHELFNVREYRRPERRFELASVVHYLDGDLWTLELIPGDTLPGDRIAALFEQVRSALWIGDRLRFRPTSVAQERTIAALAGALPVATTDEVFAGIRYQPLTEGTAFGTLRVVRGALDPASVRPDQILVLEQLPDEIPVASGVITAELQAPLGHLAILCAGRGTPNMGLRGALEHERLRALEGRLVRLEVGPQEWSLREATLDEAEAAWASRRPARPQVPRLDASERRLVDVCDLRAPSAAFAGAKAAQLGEVCSLGVETPGGFVVPMAHYVEHLGQSGVAQGLPQMLADPTFRSDASMRAARLAEVRATIGRATVAARLVREVRRRMARLAPRARWILRSSTNAEDLAGFSGAGLYRSVVVPAGAGEREIADALREVWASVWLLGAYEEREWYRVDHANVAMAVLVQPFVDGASANGVAITTNPFYEERPAFFVNAQATGGSVTGATAGELPEQHLVYLYTVPVETELLSRSSRMPNGLLLDEPALLALHERLARIHEHFVSAAPLGPPAPDQLWSGGAGAMDVEFLLASGRVVVVQARPYPIRR